MAASVLMSMDMLSLLSSRWALDSKQGREDSAARQIGYHGSRLLSGSRRRRNSYLPAFTWNGKVTPSEWSALGRIRTFPSWARHGPVSIRRPQRVRTYLGQGA